MTPGHTFGDGCDITTEGHFVTMTCVENPEWTALNAAALALFKQDHPDVDFVAVAYAPRLSVVTEYRARAWEIVRAWKAAGQAR